MLQVTGLAWHFQNIHINFGPHVSIPTQYAINLYSAEAQKNSDALQ